MTRRIVYRGRVFDVATEGVSLGARRFTVQRELTRDVVVMFPLLDDGRVLLERQYRPVLRRYIYELPAGRLNAGERPRAGAARELEEETGYRPKSMRLMFSSFSRPGTSSVVDHYFIAKGLVSGKRHLDSDEVITINKVMPDVLMAMIGSGEIIDAKTILCTLYYGHFFSGR